MNISSILDRAAGQWPDAIAVVDHRQSMTYRELEAAVESLSRAFRSTGIQQGDKLAMLFPRGAAEIVACFAAARLGAVVVQLSPASRPAEIERLAERLIFDAFIYGPDQQAFIPPGTREASRDLSVGTFSISVCRSAGQMTSRAEREQFSRLSAAAIGFSSGTTSESKAMVLSHEALLARGRAEVESFSLCDRDSIMVLLSITYGFAPPITAGLLSGATLVIADSGAPDHVIRLLREQSVTVVYGAPLVYRLLVNEFVGAPEALRRVRLFVSTGTRLPDALLEEFRARTGHEIVNRYGLNECGMVSVNLSRDPGKRGSIGRQAGCEIRLAGAGGSSTSEDSGELLVRGPGLFEGYCSPWRLRDEICEDGWFHTGDLARRDPDGCYWIIGRIKEMINVAGLKVVPAEIEDLLLSHPDVEEALVFGAPDHRFGEVAHAQIKLAAGSRADSTDVLRYVKERAAFYKVPRAVEIVADLPKTVTGKIRRRPA